MRRRVLLADASEKPVCDYVVPGLLRGTVGLIVGQGGIGKSFLALQIAIGVALGRAIGQGPGGDIFATPKNGATACIFGEDPPEILQERLYGIRQDLCPNDITAADKSVEFVSAIGEDLRIIQKGRNGQLLPGPFASHLKDLAVGKRLVILDPLVQLITGCNESDNGEMTYFMRTLAAIAQQTSSAIVVLHHVGKTREGAGEWEQSRGASAFTTNARLQLNLRPPNTRECADLGITDADCGAWVRISEVKANYNSKLRAPIWARRAENGLLQAQDPISIRALTVARSRGRNVDPS